MKRLTVFAFVAALAISSAFAGDQVTATGEDQTTVSVGHICNEQGKSPASSSSSVEDTKGAGTVDG